MKRCLAVSLLSLGLIGSGPCDFLDPAETPDAGDDTACTEIACQDGVLVTILRADNQAFLTGAYGFSATAPDGTAYAIGCYAGYGEVPLACDSGDLPVLNAAMDATGSTIALQITGAPETVTVAVDYNGYEIGRRTISPVYERVYPNGPECEPSCLSAKESMAVESW